MNKIIGNLLLALALFSISIFSGIGVFEGYRKEISFDFALALGLTMSASVSAVITYFYTKLKIGGEK